MKEMRHESFETVRENCFLLNNEFSYSTTHLSPYKRENHNLKENKLKLGQNDVENRNYFNCTSSHNCSAFDIGRNYNCTSI